MMDIGIAHEVVCYPDSVGTGYYANTMVDSDGCVRMYDLLVILGNYHVALTLVQVSQSGFKGGN